MEGLISDRCFLGRIAASPGSIDYTGNTCQYACAYCFANINDCNRKEGLKAAINFLNKEKPSTYADALLISGYPICVSNRSDPFSPNNFASTEALFTHLAERDNGVFIQTKTNPECEFLIDMLGPKKAVIYISVSILNEEKSRIVEPKAPSTYERIETMKRLRSKGYHVIAAICPCSDVWLPKEDFIVLTNELKKADVRHVRTFGYEPNKVKRNVAGSQKAITLR